MIQRNKFVLALLVLLVISLIAILISIPEKTFKKVEISQNNTVTNYTKYPYMDTIAYVGLDSLGMCEVTLEIKKLSQEAKDNFGSNYELKGLIFGAGKHYTMWIDDASRSEHVNIVSHELVHLRQYLSKQLIYDGFYVYWNRAKYDVKEMEYSTRPWEADAFERQVELSKKIKSALY